MKFYRRARAIITESKADIQAFIDKFGQDTYDLFVKSKDRLKNNKLSTDIVWHTKNTSPEEMDNMLSTLQQKMGNKDMSNVDFSKEQIPGEHKYIGRYGGYDVYQPLDYIASMALGVNTGWCTAGRWGHAFDPNFKPDPEHAKLNFNNYIRDGSELYYFLDPKTQYAEFAIAKYPTPLVLDYFFVDSNGRMVMSTNFEIYGADNVVDFGLLDKVPQYLRDELGLVMDVNESLKADNINESGLNETKRRDLGDRPSEFSNEKDYFGNRLSKEQAEYFKDSMVRIGGRLLPVYHGAKEGFDSFKRGYSDRHSKNTQGFHWAAFDREYADDYSNGGPIYAGYLNIKNVLDIGNIDSYTSEDIAVQELAQAIKVSPDEIERQMDKGKHRYLYDLTGSKWFADKVRRLGYDGVIAWESGLKTFGFFDSNQFKLIDNKNPTNSDNINEESCELFNKGLKEDMDLNFDKALLDKWIDDLNAKGAEHHQTFSYTEGGKYIKVSYTYGGRYDTAVFAFVDADGNIYKPAGWKTPAKGVRARIDDNPPVDGKDLYSARYKSAVYGESVNEAYTKDLLHTKLWNMAHKEQTCFQNGYCVTCYFHDGEGMAKRYTVTNRDGKKVLDCKYGFAWQPQIQKFEDSLLQLLNTGSIKEEILTEKPSPAGYEPTKKGIAYKVFKVKNGKLYPPMVANAGGADTPIGVWLDAEEGEFAGLSKTGRPQVKSTGSGNLSYRPGWHLGDIPRAKQFDRLNKETGEYEFPKDFVWAECEYAMDVDYQPESDARGYERTKVDKDGNVIVTKSDKYQHSLAGLPKLPTNGYYKYRTNPNPDTVPWVITGQMKVNRLLSDAEVNAILEKNGIEPIHRQGGDKTLAELGLKEGLGEDWYFHDDDSYFSHEQLLDFASDLEDAIQARHGMMFTVTSVWFEKDNSLVADVQIGKYGDDMLVSQKVDMRRVKTERDLRKYIPALVDQVTKQAVDDDY